MIELEKNGWNTEELGNIDHRIVKAPYVRMIEYTRGKYGDTVYLYDIRFTQPNKEYLDASILHSLEHFMLVGFKKYFQEKFVSVAPMGCQTGFYLILMNEYNSIIILENLRKVLNDVLLSEEVPLSTEITCGQAKLHDLLNVKKIVNRVLNKEDEWRIVF